MCYAFLYFISGHEEALSKFTLKKLLLLVCFLDYAKICRLIDHDPCLFCKDAEFKVWFSSYIFYFTYKTSVCFYCVFSEKVIFPKNTSPTLCNPIDYIYTIHGILQARILEWVAFPFSRGPSQPRDLTQVSRITGRFFTN